MERDEYAKELIEMAVILCEIRDTTAHHEAAHAVVAHVTGLGCSEASIVIDLGAGTLGRMYLDYTKLYHAGLKRNAHTIEFRRILVCMAGAEAELEFFGSCNGGDEHDLKMIADIIAQEEHDYLSPDTFYPRHEQRMREVTRRLVRKHRRAITMVACALLEHEQLTAEQIETIIKKEDE